MNVAATVAERPESLPAHCWVCYRQMEFYLKGIQYVRLQISPSPYESRVARQSLNGGRTRGKTFRERFLQSPSNAFHSCRRNHVTMKLGSGACAEDGGRWRISWENETSLLKVLLRFFLSGGSSLRLSMTLESTDTVSTRMPGG